MTTTEFLSSLQEKLHFLSEDDCKKIVAFYADQLSACASQEDVERKMNEIGTPDDIVSKVKAVAASQNEAVSDAPTTVNMESPAVKTSEPQDSEDATVVSNVFEAAGDTAVISDGVKTSVEEKNVSNDPTVAAPQEAEETIVHGAEKEADADDSILAPYKRAPLPRSEKTNKWDHLYDDNVSSDESSEASRDDDPAANAEDDEGERVSFKRRKKASNETDAQALDELDEKPQIKQKKEIKPFTGPNLMDSMMKKSGKTPEEAKGMFNLLRVLFVLPLLLISLLLVGCYAITVLLVASVVVALIVLTLIFGLCGVAGLAYGFVSFFTQSGVIAVIEIGLATILFSIVVALIALCYELIAGIIPVLIRKLTALYLWLIRWFCYKLTGKNSLRELFAAKK